MAVSDQYNLLRDAGYAPNEAADLLGIDDPDSLEAPPSPSPKSPQPSSTFTPYDRYQSCARDIYRRELLDDPELTPSDIGPLMDVYEVEPDNPDMHDFFNELVEEYYDQLEAEYVEKQSQSTNGADHA